MNKRNCVRAMHTLWHRTPICHDGVTASAQSAGELQIVASRTGGQAGVIGAATMVIQHVLSVDQVEHQLAGAAAV